jgi:hypothetical protein
MHSKGVEMSHELYIQILSAMFLFWNGARILTYLPTIGKLLARETDIRSHSLLSWGSWTLSNGTFALMLLEMSRGIPNGMFWMNLANTLMCVIVLLIILFRRFPRLYTGVSKVYGKVRQNEPTPGALSERSALLDQGAGSVTAGANLAVGRRPGARQRRSGRPALWVASAGALAFGAVGAVTVDLRPDHDQSSFVPLKAGAQETPAMTVQALPPQQEALSGPATPSIAPPSRATVIARAELTPPALSASLEHRAVPSRGSTASRPVTRARPVKAGNAAAPDRGNWASHFMASVKQALGITRSTPPKHPTASSGRGTASSPASARGTAVAHVEIARHAPSASYDHGAALPRDFAAPQQVATTRPGHADDFAPQERSRSAHNAVYAAPPTAVFDTTPVAYAQMPVAYGYGYEGGYRESRQWHDNGLHKGVKHRQHEENDD